jgi:hypothetical protein
MFDPALSLLAEPIRTPRGIHLAADGLDPYETFAAYFYGLEMEVAKKHFDPERFAEIWLAVDGLLGSWPIHPS